MPHITSFKIENFRALQKVEFKDLQPLNVFLGPNGCGKSTIFDAFQFIADCLQTNVRKALEARGRFREVRSRGAKGPIAFTIKYRESDFGATRKQQTPVITYHLAISEADGQPVVSDEYCRWTRSGRAGRPFDFLRMVHGEGSVVSGEAADSEDQRVPVKMADRETLAISALGQLAENPRVVSLREFIEGWYLSYFVPEQARGVPPAGAEEHLSRTGDNLPNVVQFLAEQHPETLRTILERVARRVPGLETVAAEETRDHRVILHFKDGPWDDPFLAKYVSDGTIKMFAYLVLLSDPDPPPLFGIEEPENGLHPKLLQLLAEEFRAHARGGEHGKSTQAFVSSHSPYFLNALRPEELWVMERDKTGYANVWRSDTLEGVPEFHREDERLGALWLENHLQGKGNPRVL